MYGIVTNVVLCLNALLMNLALCHTRMLTHRHNQETRTLMISVNHMHTCRHTQTKTRAHAHTRSTKARAKALLGNRTQDQRY